MTIFTRPRWCIEPLRSHGEAAVSTATTMAAPFTRIRKQGTGCAPGQKHKWIERWRAADE